jgi:uncharacterized protein (DUF1499 family)
LPSDLRLEDDNIVCACFADPASSAGLGSMHFQACPKEENLAAFREQTFDTLFALAPL